MALPMKASVMKSSRARGAKVMKAKRVSKIARGKMRRAMVLRGSRERTTSGLTKEKLMWNKFGKIVSKKASAVHLKLYQTSTAKVWAECISAARKALSLKGFVAINGKRPEGKALYEKAKALYVARK